MPIGTNSIQDPYPIYSVVILRDEWDREDTKVSLNAVTINMLSSEFQISYVPYKNSLPLYMNWYGLI